MNIKYQVKRTLLKLTSFLRPTLIAKVCGHKTKLAGEIYYFGRTSIFKMILGKYENPDYCLECIAKMTIQCAWCKNPITIGSPITLYTQKDSEIPKHAVQYTKGSLKTLVGCTHKPCIDLPDDMSGHWTPPGKVMLGELPTPFV